MTLPVNKDDTDISPLVARSRDVSKVLKLLSNQKRLLILCKLAAVGECPVHALAETIDLSQSALSQHLAKLRRDGLVTYRRESQMLYYALGDPQLKHLLIALKDIYCPKEIAGASKENEK